MKQENNAACKDFMKLLTEEKKTEILKKAQEAMDGMLVLNGTGPQPYYVGKPPRWHENPFGVGGYTWTMSRLMYMTGLCKAYLITGNADYMEKVITDLTDWLEKAPAPPVPVDEESAMVYHGIHHWRMLEVGFRTVYTFPILLPVLEVYGAPEELMEQLRICIHQHGERIYAGSHYLWPGKDHNHYLMEMVGLLGAAALNPSDPEAAVWAGHAIKEVEECCFRQISEAGGQIEGAVTYHNDCRVHFCMAVYKARSLGMDFSRECLERIKKGIDFSVYTLRPDGRGVTIGDSDPDKVAVDCAVLGYLLFEDCRWIRAVGQLVPVREIREAALGAWGFPHIGALLNLLKQQKDVENEFPLENYQDHIQQYYARTSWDKEALSLVFICRSPVHYGCHGHIDPLSFDFTAYGKPLLVDPGRYTYKDGEDRHLYKSSAVHNMPTLNGRDAFEYISTFVFGKQQPGAITKVVNTDRIKSAAGYHDNYAPARLTRIIGIIDGRFLLIVDTFLHGEGETAQIFFHLNSTNVKGENGIVRTADEDVNLLLCSTISQTDILEGRLSDVFYHDYPSRRAVFSQYIETECFTAVTVAVPYKGMAPQETGIRLEHDPFEKTVRFALEGHSYEISYDEESFHIQNSMTNV